MKLWEERAWSALRRITLEHNVPQIIVFFLEQDHVDL